LKPVTFLISFSYATDPEVFAMNAVEDLENGGWRIGQSIVMELDVALMAAGEDIIGANLSAEVMAFFQSVSTDWQDEYRALVGDSRNFLPVLETAANLAGTDFESDYSHATLATREMVFDKALARVKRESAKLGIKLESGLPLQEQFVDLALKLKIATFLKFGLVLTPDPQKTSVLRRTYQHIGADGKARHDCAGRQGEDGCSAGYRLVAFRKPDPHLPRTWSGSPGWAPGCLFWGRAVRPG
jgi:hypothetical protein